MTTLVEEYAADIRLDSFRVAAPSLEVWSTDSKILSLLGVDRVWSSMKLPALCEQVEVAHRNNGVTYCQVLDRARPKERVLVVSAIRWRDLISL